MLTRREREQFDHGFRAGWKAAISHAVDRGTLGHNPEHLSDWARDSALKKAKP